MGLTGRRRRAAGERRVRGGHPVPGLRLPLRLPLVDEAVSDLGWRADGIARAEAAGGVTLERYRRPGFHQGPGVRKRPGDGYAQGFETYTDPECWEMEDDRARRRGRDR